MTIIRLVRALCTSALALAAFAVFAASPWDAGSDGLKPIPALSARVTDLTATLSAADKQALEAKLAAFEQQTGGQMVVLIVPSTQPEPIESYSIRVAEAWKIGRKGQDNGVLFLIAKNDRKMRIEVGYGYEGVLPDITARRIIAEDVAPRFRDGKFAEGINAGVDRVLAIIVKGGEALPPKPAAKQPSWTNFDPGMFFILLFVVIPVVGGILKRILGRLAGSAVGAGIVGAAAWFVAGSLLIAGIAGVVALLVMLFAGGVAGLARGGGGWIPPSGGSGGFGGGFGGGGGGGGFSGGGGSFGGGGASGDW